MLLCCMLFHPLEVSGAEGAVWLQAAKAIVHSQGHDLQRLAFGLGPVSLKLYDCPNIVSAKPLQCRLHGVAAELVGLCSEVPLLAGTP